MNYFTYSNSKEKKTPLSWTRYLASCLWIKRDMDKNKVRCLWIKREMDKKQRTFKLKNKTAIRTTVF